MNSPSLTVAYFFFHLRTNDRYVLWDSKPEGPPIYIGPKPPAHAVSYIAGRCKTREWTPPSPEAGQPSSFNPQIQWDRAMRLLRAPTRVPTRIDNRLRYTRYTLANNRTGCYIHDDAKCLPITCGLWFVRVVRVLLLAKSIAIPADFANICHWITRTLTPQPRSKECTSGLDM